MLALFIVCKMQGKIPTSLKTYYHCVNQAELALMDSNYSSAINFYKKAFAHKKSPFIKDRFNLALCYAIQNKFRKCYDQLIPIIDKGGSVHQIMKRPEFSDFFNSLFGSKLIIYQSSHKRTYNLQYRATLDSLIAIDQKFRKMKGGYEIYSDTIRKIDSLNVITLNQLIAQYGFPSEDLVGVDTSLLLIRPIYSVLIIHQQSGSPNRFWNYSDLISQALNTGDIEVHAAAEYIWKCSGKDKMGVMDAGLVQLILDTISSESSSNIKPDRASQPLGYFKMSPEKEKSVNTARDSLGLETIFDARRKTAFMQNNHRFILPSSTVSVLVCSSQAQYDKMVKSIIWIE